MECYCVVERQTRRILLVVIVFPPLALPPNNCNCYGSQNQAIQDKIIFMTITLLVFSPYLKICYSIRSSSICTFRQMYTYHNITLVFLSSINSWVLPFDLPHLCPNSPRLTEKCCGLSTNGICSFLQGNVHFLCFY